MNSVIEKYYPLMIRTFALLNFVSILCMIVFYVTDFISTKQGAAIFELGTVYVVHSMGVLLIIIFVQKYAIYAISTYPLTLFILFTRFCTYDDTLMMNEWSMSFIGALFNM